MRPAIACLRLCLLALPAIAQDFEVIDGDTLKAPWSERFRIVGIDAPEIGQECERNAAPYPFGQEAKKALTRLLRGKKVVCEPEGGDSVQTVAVARRGGDFPRKCAQFHVAKNYGWS
jgi:endonuclease YncB( thermonuclease family)